MTNRKRRPLPMQYQLTQGEVLRDRFQRLVIQLPRKAMANADLAGIRQEMAAATCCCSVAACPAPLSSHPGYGHRLSLLIQPVVALGQW